MMEKNFESLWMAQTKGENYKKLDKNISVDIAIVGGGMAGLMIAYFFMKKGHKIAILEAGSIAGGTSGYTTAKITSLHDLKYSFLEKNVGIDGARIYGESNQWAIDKLKKIIQEENIACDFHIAPSYVFAKTKEGLKQIEEEVEASKKINLPASFLTTDENIPFPIEGEIKFEDQAYFHPRKFLMSIAKILSKNGVELYENARVEDIKEGSECEITAGKNIIKARKVVVATNFPVYDKGLFFLRMNQMRSYALAAKLNCPLPDGMYIGTDEERLTFRPHISEEGDWLIIGGQDQVTGDIKENDDPFEKLEMQARKYFPIKSIDYKWAAQDSMPIDRYPYIGIMPKSENIYVATGFREWGMTTSVVSAKIISDLIETGKNEWENFYTPSRLNVGAALKGVPSQVKHVAKGFGAYVTKNAPDLSKLSYNEGTVMDVNGEKIATFRDENGGLHSVSAKCTHMGCIVNWNKTEKSWDCPCHGSRFNVDGEILNSPAKYPLPKKNLEEA